MSKSKANAKDIDWTDERVEWLLHTIQSNNGHIVKGTHEVGRLWERIGHEFYGHNMMREYLEAVNQSAIEVVANNGVRKLKEKFANVYKTCTDLMASGNLSAKDGDLNRKYRTVQTMKSEIDKAKAKARDAKRTKMKLNGLAVEILAGEHADPEQPTKRKFKELGTAGASKPAKKAPTLSEFEQKLITMLDTDSSGNDGGAAKAEMKAWAAAFNKTLNDMIAEAELIQSDENQSLVQFTVNLLISIYCAPPDSFSHKHFKAEVCELGVSPNNAHRLFDLLDNWRIEAHHYAIAGSSSATQHHPHQLTQPATAPVRVSTPSSDVAAAEVPIEIESSDEDDNNSVIESFLLE